MARRKIALEFKNRHLTRPMLDQIVGAQIRTNPDATEIIIRCRSAAKTAYAAIDDFSIPIKIVPRESTSND